jgi:cysteine desulfurase / selenocysteine lyase
MGKGLRMDWKAFREEFPVTRNYNFQNHAAVGPLCRRAAEAAREYLDSYRDHAYLQSDFYHRVEHVRQKSAELIRANPDEVTFIKNTSEGLSFVANGLSWQSGDNVVTTNVEFPANVYPWQNLRSRGVQLQVVLEENGRIPLDKLLAAVNSRTRVVAISSVQYASGFRTDLTALGEHCQSKGVLLCVDAIQSLGVSPVDVKRMNIDFLAADGHKWLCGPEGCGIFYVRKEVQGFLKPTCVGWMSMKRPTDFERLHFEFDESARRYDSGAYNLVGIAALGGALDTLLGVGIEVIASRVQGLTELLVEGVRARGYHVVSSRRPGEASGIVAFTSDLHDPTRIQRHLQTEHRLAISVRSGRLRASPHAYNTEGEIQQLVDLLPKH